MSSVKSDMISQRTEFLREFLCRFRLPMPDVVVKRAEAAAPHAIDVQGSLQMIDLMLQNASVPALRLDVYGFSKLIQGFDRHLSSTRHHSEKTRQAETSLEKRNIRR